MTSTNFSEVLSEIYEIINHMDNTLYVKIPHSFISFIDTNRNKDYKSNIDFSQDINNQNLKRETRAILAVLYRDYLCSEEERKRLIIEDEEYFSNLNKEYWKHKVFQTDKKQIQSTPDSKPVVIQKEWFFKKILKRIKAFFITMRIKS